VNGFQNTRLDYNSDNKGLQTKPSISRFDLR